jgi:hypothetical protein
LGNNESQERLWVSFWWKYPTGVRGCETPGDGRRTGLIALKAMATAAGYVERVAGTEQGMLQ